MQEITERIAFNTDDLGLSLDNYQLNTDYEQLMTQGNETGQ